MSIPVTNFDLILLQKCQNDMLKEIDHVCKENNISYQLFAGTLLGAVRHQGFIPWDDDIDICMSRDNYERFLDCCSDKVSEDYFLQTYKSDPEYIHTFARLRKNNTLLIQDNYAELKMHHGIFIDIFPLDRVKPNSSAGKMQRKLLEKIYNIKRYKIKKRFKKYEKNSTYYKGMLLHYLLKPISMKNMNRLQEFIQKGYQHQETGYVSELGMSLSEDEYRKFTIPAYLLEETVNGIFEGREYPIPKDYDVVLSSYYGKYMKYPPQEERYPHHSITELIFDTRSVSN